MFQFLIIVSVIRSGDLKTKATRECTYLLLYTAELSHIKRVNLKAGFARPYALYIFIDHLYTFIESLNHCIVRCDNNNHCIDTCIKISTFSQILSVALGL